MIVTDASVVVDFLLGVGSDAGDAFAGLLAAGEQVCAPHLLDAEVGQVLRRYTLNGDLEGDQADSLLADFLAIPVKRYPHTALLQSAFDLRSNVTVYDGIYLALAEALRCRFLTCDVALENVPGCTAEVEVLRTSA